MGGVQAGHEHPLRPVHRIPLSFATLSQKDLPNVGKIGPDTLVRGDCLDVMAYLADGSIDLVLADLPYG